MAHDEIRARGLRLTPQRQLVLNAVRELGHATPEDIAQNVRQMHPGINLSTVYRNLETLETAGFIVHTHLGHGGATYHAADEITHLHLVCGQCGKVDESELDDAKDFVDLILKKRGFATDVTHFAIYGTCAKCQVK